MNRPTYYLALHFALISSSLIILALLSALVSLLSHSSLHASCDRQITYCKLNCKIEYPPPYQPLVWKFKKANATSIRITTLTVNWKFLFFNKSVHEHVSIFNNTLMNIFSNYIPNKFVTIDDKDPPWMTENKK